jgi:hypothetical protein
MCLVDDVSLAALKEMEEGSGKPMAEAGGSVLNS